MKNKMMGYPEFGATDSLAFMYLTTRCNLNCGHCYVGDKLKTANDMPFEMVNDFLAYARTIGFRQVSFLGGEPLLYPHLLQAVERARAEGFKVFLGTNGVSAPPKGLAVDYLSISADHCAPGGSDICQGGFAPERLVLFKSIAEHLSFTVTLSTENAHLVEDYLKISAEVGVDSILFHYFTPLGNGRNNLHKVIQREDYEKLTDQIERVSGNYSLSVRYQKKFVRREDAEKFARTSNLKYFGNKSRFMGEGIAIFPDGSIHFDPLFFDKEPVGFFEGNKIAFNKNSVQLESLFSIDPKCLTCHDKKLCGGPDSAAILYPQHEGHGLCCEEFIPIETTWVTNISPKRNN